MLTIAVASGKGGVGKTMLAVAIATELSRRTKTLLFDLDFFNRGLTGLFASLIRGSSKIQLSPPELFATLDIDWYAVEVAPNLLMIAYEDINQSSSAYLERLDTQQLALCIKELVMQARDITSCEMCVLDCHGGPDNTSFAACIFANFTILVSEPDKITLYGTLNFVRQMETAVGERARRKLHLIFNKVIPAFRSWFLFKFYQNNLKSEFENNPLLAVYPLEAHLTKAFETTPFLTIAYPTSQLARKTRLLLYDLLVDIAPGLAPEEISWIRRTVRRYYMGRLPIIMNFDFLFRLITLMVVVKLLADYIGWNLPEGVFQDILLVGIVLWLLFVALVNWSRDLDIFATYSFRTSVLWQGIVGSALLFSLWCLVAFVLGSGLRIYLISKERLQAVDQTFKVVFCVIALFSSLYISVYILRGLRNIVSEQRYVEGSIRIGTCLVVATVFFSCFLGWFRP